MWVSGSLIRLSYDFLEQNAPEKERITIESQEKSTDLGEFFRNINKTKDNNTNLGKSGDLAKYFENLQFEQVSQFKSSLIQRGYNTQSLENDPQYFRQALFIEYIKAQTKISDRNDTTISKVRKRYQNNPQSGTTKNQRRMIQAYLYLNDYFDKVSNKGSFWDEVDGIIAGKTQTAMNSLLKKQQESFKPTKEQDEGENYLVKKSIKKNDSSKQQMDDSNNDGEPNKQDGTVDFIKKFEGFKPKAYRDSTGRSVGYGFHYINGRRVTKNDTMTRDQADQLLTKKIESHQTRKDKIQVLLSKSQQTALTSFEYNVGSNTWNTDSGQKIIAAINTNNIQEAANIMSKFVKSNGKKLGGLVARRGEERKLLLGDQDSVA